MTNTTLDKIEMGDLVMDYGGDVGVISKIEYWGDEDGTHLYFVLWSSGYLTGYSTAHKPKEIRAWTKNVRLST